MTAFQQAQIDASLPAEKMRNLAAIITKHRSAAIAFSGGVDSTLLAAICGELLEKHVLLVTATSQTYPSAELDAAQQVAGQLKLPHRVIVSEELDIPGFSENPPDRCYYCKRELFDKIAAIARAEKMDAVFDGSNADDLKDYRPGRRALAELGIVSPLCEAGLTKEEIRAISQAMGLSTATKPSYACLASRFPYGEMITSEKLRRVEQVEASLRRLGFGQLRVRSHGDVARIEFAGPDMERAWSNRIEVSKACHAAGFVFSALDLDGYRTGAMNEALESATAHRGAGAASK